MKKFFFGAVLFAVVLTAACAAERAGAEDTSQDETNFRYQKVTTKSGLTFRVPEDMPIEKRGGIEAPIPFDEYMYGKFKQMDVRLARIEAHLRKIETLLVEGSEGRMQSVPPSTSA